jgi:hypothetical protein
MAKSYVPKPGDNVVCAGVVAVAPAPTNAGKNGGAKVMEEVMGNAIKQALADGIPINSPLIKERMMAARRAAGGR